MLNSDDSVSRSSLEVPFTGLFVFEIYSVTNLEGGWLSLLSSVQF